MASVYFLQLGLPQVEEEEEEIYLIQIRNITAIQHK